MLAREAEVGTTIMGGQDLYSKMLFGCLKPKISFQLTVLVSRPQHGHSCLCEVLDIK